MKKLKVVTIVGTRPEIIRLSALIPRLDEFTEHVLVHTGQNSDRNLNDVFFEDLKLRRPDHFLAVDTSSMASVMGDVIKKSAELFESEQPDAVMILGDTNSSIAAVVAERMHIPVYHMEAGNRSFDANVPEELNRRLVDHVSTFNLPYNSYSKANLVREGIDPRYIHVTGSPLREVISNFEQPIRASSVLLDLGLDPDQYLLASFHRQENVDNPERLAELVSSISKLASELSLRVIVSTHPRTRRRLETLDFASTGLLEFLEPFGYLDYNKLQLESRCVLSDSGTISEEATLLGFRAICIRDSFERPESIESGVTLAGVEYGDIRMAYEMVMSLKLEADKLPEGYDSMTFSSSVLSYLFSTAKRANSWLGRRPMHG